MNKSGFDDQAFITVVCPVCGTRLDEAVTDQPRSTKCPDCFTQVPVPARDAIPAAPVPPPLPDVGTYRMQQMHESVNGRTDPETARRQKQRERAMVLVVCPLCAARIDTLARKQSRVVKCPDCYELVCVPSLAEVEQKRQRQPKPRPAPAVEALPVPAPEAPPATVPSFFADARATIRREETSLPPKHPFVSGVFGLPWHAEVFGRWLYLSAGLSIMHLLMAFLYLMGSETAGSRFGMVVAFFVLPLIWIGTWAWSYAAVCCRAVLEDTAAGNQQIVSWHEQHWKEWVLVLSWIGFQAGLSLIVGHLTGRLGEHSGGPYLPLFLAATWVSFPVILLSSLEADSLFVPLSGPIVRSLRHHVGSWVTFYLVATLTVLIPLLLLVLTTRNYPYLLAFLSGPVSATILLIYARLLGRLGWVISQDDRRPQSRVRPGR